MPHIPWPSDQVVSWWEHLTRCLTVTRSTAGIHLARCADLSLIQVISWTDEKHHFKILYPTVCPFQVSCHLMEGYSVDTQNSSKIPSWNYYSNWILKYFGKFWNTNQKEFPDYLAYWLNYIHFSDWILEMDKLYLLDLKDGSRYQGHSAHS